MPISLSEFFLGFVVPGIIATVAGAFLRWPLVANSKINVTLFGGLIIGAFFLGCDQLETLEEDVERYMNRSGAHWVPFFAAAAVLISLIDELINSKLGRVLQAVIFLGFLPLAAWWLIPDYPIHAEFRTWTVTGFALMLGLIWCSLEFAGRKQVGPFPVLLGAILIGAIGSGTIVLLPLLSAALTCGVMVAVIAGAALFTTAAQHQAAKPMAALFSVCFCGLLYAAYAGLPVAFSGENLKRDLAAVLAAVSPCLLFLYGWGKDAEGRLAWSRGALVTGLCLVPAVAALALAYMQAQ